MNESIDFTASLFFGSALTVVLGAHGIARIATGRPLVAERVLREAAFPLFGKAPMHAVVRALMPLGRGLAALGISANAVTVSSLIIAVFAAIAFARGQFGVAAVIAAIAALADGLDGLIARATNTESRFGRVLDTTVDRYVDALFLGGIAVHVRADLVLLVTALAAIVGSFAVSYASSVERELGVVARPAPMRRAHRLAYLLLGSACAPLAVSLAHDPRAGLVPVFAAVGAIAIVGNVSAVRRLLAAAQSSP